MIKSHFYGLFFLLSIIEFLSEFMKLLVIVYNGLWDACFPLLESLQDKCELYCALELIPEHPNILEITGEDFKHSNIIAGKDVAGLKKYSRILPIERTFILRKHTPKKVLSFIRDSIIEKRFIEEITPDFVYFYHDPIYSLSFIYSNKTPWGIAVHSRPVCGSVGCP